LKLKSQHIFLLLVLFLNLNSWSQAYVVDGVFRGENLKIQGFDAKINKWGPCNCIDSVAVNGEVIDDLIYEGKEIDIANKADLSLDDTVQLHIYHPADCKFRLLNPHVFLPKVLMPIDSLWIENESVIHWVVPQHYSKLRLWVQLERKVNDSWSKIGPDFYVMESDHNSYNVSSYLKKGKNEIRAVIGSAVPHRIPSRSVTIISRQTNATTLPIESYVFKGFFRGENLNIQCRKAMNELWLSCNCIDSVQVNGITCHDIIYEGYQIDIANKADVDLYDTLEIELFYQKGCDFRFLNPNMFQPKTIQAVDSFWQENDSILHWTLAEVYPDLKLWVQIEQYKWGEWSKIGNNHNILDSAHFSTNISSYLFKGENQFRAVVSTIDHDRIPSDTITIKSKAKKVKCKYKKKKNQIVFSRESRYSIYNFYNLISMRGIASEVDVDSLAKGKYIVKYSNKIYHFEIK
jgi:hypothetical protein